MNTAYQMSYTPNQANSTGGLMTSADFNKGRFAKKPDFNKQAYGHGMARPKSTSSYARQSKTHERMRIFKPKDPYNNVDEKPQKPVERFNEDFSTVSKRSKSHVSRKSHVSKRSRRIIRDQNACRTS